MVASVGALRSSRTSGAAEPPRDCMNCERLVSYREANRAAEPDWYNGPVPSWGSDNARLLIVGLAPGVRGANRTGRPFTGDFAGDLLYQTLIDYGFAVGRYGADPSDGLKLADCMITNAVRCVPPQNKPTPAEISTCRSFLGARISSLSNMTAVLALGRIAHDSVLSALGARKSAYPFAHAARHEVSQDLVLFDSYHCSRYNTNTGKLTPEMFQAVFRAIRGFLGPAR